jgi:hypothetical protein
MDAGFVQRIRGHCKALAADLHDASSEHQAHLAASADETAPKSPNLVIKVMITRCFSPINFKFFNVITRALLLCHKCLKCLIPASCNEQKKS